MKKILIAVMGLAMGILSLNSAYANQAVVKGSNEVMEIIMANFGDNDKRCDAKAIVSKACDRKESCELPAMMEICGSAKSMERKLTVLYTCRDKSYTVVTREGDVARLDCRRGVSGVDPFLSR